LSVVSENGKRLAGTRSGEQDGWLIATKRLVRKEFTIMPQQEGALSSKRNQILPVGTAKSISFQHQCGKQLRQ
jgi:hypothetical protein